MDVFLIPISATRYEPYCEVPEAQETSREDPADAAGAPGPITRFAAGLVQRFSHVLATIERRANEKTADTPTTRIGWLKEAAYHRLAHWMASQRLLWRLRKLDAATLVHPSDLDARAAHGALRAYFDREQTRHTLFVVLYSLLGVLSIPVALVPGPNVLGYLFVFLLVGHFFSWRGARRGKSAVAWTERASDVLADLRRVPPLGSDDREPFLRAAAQQLGLVHLVALFERLGMGAA